METNLQPAPDQSYVVGFREVRWDDREQIYGLQKKLGLDADSPEDWERIWKNNPQRRDDVPMGWVLETGPKIVGFLGNVPLTYDFNGTAISAVAARGWVVEPEYRQHTLKLILRYLGQKNIDILLNSSSNDIAFKIFQGLGAQLVPVKTYASVMFWIINAAGFVRSVFRKMNFKGGVGSFVTFVVSYVVYVFLQPLLWIVKTRLSRRRAKLFRGPKVLSGTNLLLETNAALSATKTLEEFAIKILEPHQVGAEFDGLWVKKKAERPRFLADRSAHQIRWHFGRRDASVTIIACYRGGELFGYAACVEKKSESLGFRRLQIADFIVLNDDAAATELLLVEAYFLARKKKVDALELVALTASIRTMAGKMGALSRRSFPTPFTYKIINRQKLSPQTLVDPKTWYTSLYDGDGTL